MDNLSAWDAATSRSRERSLRQQSLECTTLAGVFTALAERGDDAVVRLVGGAGLRTGAVASVGADFAVVGSAFVPFGAVASVRSVLSERPPVSGNRVVEGGLTFAQAVARLAEDRPRVSALFDGAESLTGTLEAAGDGVVLIDGAWAALDALRALLVV